jgi:putative transposase
MKPARKHNRLPGFDYSREAVYFVTSCVKDMACVFGEVVEGEMVLNSLGHIAENQWQAVMERYPYVYSHAFVVMPNHVHGLVEINQQWEKAHGETCANRPLFSPENNKIKSISELIGAYKSTTSKCIRLAGLPAFTWQRSFHDHIIRHEQAYQNIKTYIETNPAKWQDDIFRR